MISLEYRMRLYETDYTYVLKAKTPAIIRLDGINFSTWTKELDNLPFNQEFSNAMFWTAQELVHAIQNVVLAYTASDEISLLLVDYKNEHSEQAFGGRVQKLTSTAASLATAWFNHYCENEVKSLEVPVLFDARTFSLPKEEVLNYFIWRQNDTKRNAVQRLARKYFSHKQLDGKSCADLITILEEFHGVKFDESDIKFRHGEILTPKESRDSVPNFSSDKQFLVNLIGAYL